MFKKALPYLTIIIPLIILYIYDSNPYTIKIEDTSNLQEELTNWINHSSESNTIEILSTTPLVNTTTQVVLFNVNHTQDGYAQLIKGWNGKYKIEYSSSSPSNSLGISYTNFTTNRGPVGVIIIFDYLDTAHLVKVRSIDDDKILMTMLIENKKNYIYYEPLPKSEERKFGNALVYDIEGNEILPSR